MDKVKKPIECCVCKNKFSRKDVAPLDTIRDSLLKTIYSQNPQLKSVPDNAFICQDDLNKVRKTYFRQLLDEEKGDLNEIEDSIVEALHQNESLSKKERKKIPKLTFGERLSDDIAKFGGSWTFIIFFVMAMTVWILWNTMTRLRFDPYPFILLNLFLSCLAALQAPIIMMSQNRQADRDRKNQENDYKVNLKSEIEVRILNEKLDKLMSHQWQRLLEIQEMQIDFMEELVRQKNK